MVRNYVRKTDKGSYSKEKFREAVRAIQNGQLSGYKASQLYKIPRMTLMDHVNNKRFKSNTLGRSTALPLDIEEKLASCLHLMEKNGFGLSKQEVLEMVGDYVRLNGLETPFKDDVPGEAWFYGFKNRHNLSVKKPQGVEYARKKAIDPFIVYPYFDLLEKTVDELNLRDKPSAIWNVDETSFSKDPSKTKIVGAKGHAATRVISSPGKDNTTVLLGANALGEKVPPLIVFKGKNVWDEWTTPDGYPETSYAATTNGWMETTVFETYFKKTFLPAAGSHRPILLVYDGHSTHVSLNIIEEARKQNVTIIKLPPHSSHVLQPLDVSVMKSFKDKWDAHLVKWQRLNVGITLPKKEFARLIGVIWKTIEPQVICNGFRKAGVFPQCREEVSEKEFDALKLQKWKNSQSVTLQHEDDENITIKQMENDLKVTEKDPIKQPHSLLSLSLKISNHLLFTTTSHTTSNCTSSKEMISAPITPISNPIINFCINNWITNSNTPKHFKLSKVDVIAGSSNSFSNSQMTLNKKKDAKIEVLEDIKVKANFTFEELLLSKVKAGNALKVKRRKIAEGAEVITHDDVLRRKMDEAIKNIKKEKPLKKKQKLIKKSSKNKKKREHTKNKVSDSSESDCSLPELNDESDYENIQDFCEDILNFDNEFDATGKENISDNAPMEPERIGSEYIEHKPPKVGDWLLVKFATKKTIKHYLGVVTAINSDRNPVVQYLRTASRRNNKRVFSYPYVDDISELRNLEDIVLFLPEPIKERRGLIHFENVSFDNYNIQ